MVGAAFGAVSWFDGCWYASAFTAAAGIVIALVCGERARSGVDVPR
jgi:hypothetical protein